MIFEYIIEEIILKDLETEETLKFYSDILKGFKELETLNIFHTDFRGIFVGYNKETKNYVLIDNLNNKLDFE